MSDPKGGLSAELRAVLESLLVGTKTGDAIELDAIGEAIGARFVSQDDIDQLITTIEARGRTITTREGGRGEADLKVVLVTARRLRATLGRAPRPDEIAKATDLSLESVRHALALAKIMQR